MEGILVFGDSLGVPLVIESAPRELIRGIVAAEIRPQDHDKLSRMAAECSVPFLVQPRKQSQTYDAFLNQVKSVDHNLIIVNSYSMLVHPEILALPALGGVNVHPALLPKYRGSNPLQWVIINNENETGVTLHYMTGEFDAGDIIAQRRVPIFLEDTWLDLRSRIVVKTREMLGAEIPRILAGTNNRTPQNEAEVSKSPRRRPEDGEIDWSHSVRDIHNLIRALVPPLPGAFYYSAGKKIVLDRYLSLAEVGELKARQTRETPNKQLHESELPDVSR
jgi:methionyl-tRNA formyltransferase